MALYEESNVPIKFLNAHLLDQIGDAGFFKKENRHRLPTHWICSKPADKIRLHVFVSVMDVMSIDPIGEKFDIKYRLYLIWKANLEELGLNELAEKTLASGNYHLLSRAEYDHLASVMAIPIPILSNKINETETDPADIRCYGGTPDGTAFMWNKAFQVTCCERFELQNFPFDMQDLSLEFRLNDPKTWDKYDLTVVSVQFHKQALYQTEWKAYGPVIKRDSPAHKVTKVSLKFGRLSWFYIQNIVLAMLFISSLALLSFVMEISDLGSRVSTCLTVVLTIVAFKFITSSSLPKVPYNTVVDIYINASSGALILVTYFSVVPSLFLPSGDGGDTNSTIPSAGTAVLTNQALGWFSLALVLFIFIAWDLYALRIAHSWKLTKPILIKEDKNWYSFRFSTPDFLDEPKPGPPASDSLLQACAAVPAADAADVARTAVATDTGIQVSAPAAPGPDKMAYRPWRHGHGKEAAPAAGQPCRI